MMVRMPVYVIIPARGGSKGVPGKNLRRVGGVPLVVRAIHAASSAAGIDAVFVSTDDDAIACAATEAGAEVIRRPAELSGDDATSESALLHALDVIAQRDLEAPDIVVMMQCTSPLTTSVEVEGTLSALAEESADCAFTGARSHAFLWRRGPDGAVAVNHDASRRLRRQEQELEYGDTGAVYAMRTAGFLRSRSRFFGRIAIYEVPDAHAPEIDTEADFAVAETLLRVTTTVDGSALPAHVVGLALDFDGVMTDNRVVTFQDGTEAVLCDRADGMGIELLRATDVEVVVLSKEANPVVTARCDKLHVACRQGIVDKLPAFRSWMADHELDPSDVVFVGNDVNDVDCLLAAGCGVVVADAHPSAVAAADLVLSSPGGHGAVREIADLILARVKGA